MSPSSDGLTVAVTGPTGDIGRSLLAALDRSSRVGRVVGMARRPFDPAEHGWSKVEYRQGDVLDRASLDALVADADVVVHLAFLIFGDREESRQVNLQGSRNVFEATVAAGAKRLIYTSSIAAYGFHPDNPEILREQDEPRGTDDFYYSAQKAELEALVWKTVEGSGVDTYVFRPCIVAGPDALLLIDSIAKQFQLGGRLPVEREVLRALPFAAPLLPDPGVPIQLVHHDDCAEALLAAAEGRGPAGIYNIAGPGTITMKDLAQELGWRSLPVPPVAVRAGAKLIARLGDLLPQDFAWINGVSRPVTMDATKALRELEWFPRYDARETLEETVRGARLAGIV
jgi:nucleoside-diphosphate-sugar epimerase